MNQRSSIVWAKIEDVLVTRGLGEERDAGNEGLDLRGAAVHQPDIGEGSPCRLTATVVDIVQERARSTTLASK